MFNQTIVTEGETTPKIAVQRCGLRQIAPDEPKVMIIKWSSGLPELFPHRITADYGGLPEYRDYRVLLEFTWITPIYLGLLLITPDY